MGRGSFLKTCMYQNVILWVLVWGSDTKCFGGKGKVYKNPLQRFGNDSLQDVAFLRQLLLRLWWSSFCPSPALLYNTEKLSALFLSHCLPFLAHHVISFFIPTKPESRLVSSIYSYKSGPRSVCIHVYFWREDGVPEKSWCAEVVESRAETPLYLCFAKSVPLHVWIIPLHGEKGSRFTNEPRWLQIVPNALDYSLLEVFFWRYLRRDRNKQDVKR